MAAEEKVQSGSRETGEVAVAIVLAALSRPAGERSEFIREACSHDLALAAEVGRRVEWEERMKGFLLEPLFSRERLDHPFATGDALLEGRFHILGIAGEGGMGVVYEAFDRKLDCRVALKCPHYEFRKRLPPEAMKALSVAHPNVCRVFGVHTAALPGGEVDFFTMEFLAGETLGARLERERPERWLESSEGRLIAQQICDGLAAVHAQGIVHRDLKASNVMLSVGRSGETRAVIMDFGIAQGTDLFSSNVRGTPAYLAPELWRGQPATVASDIYALAVLLYEMASGRKPFAEGVSWEQRFKAVPPPATAREPLRSALARALDPDPARRFPSVDAFQRALWNRSRRWLIGGVAASAAGAVLLKERFWPASPVRLAVLPPGLGDGAATAAPLVSGFAHDLSYRFKTLRGTQRPFFVFSATQSSSDGVKDAAAARTLFGATHALTSDIRRVDGNWRLNVTLTESGSPRPLRSWQRAAPPSGLAAELFALQSSVVEESLQALALRTEAKRQSLSGEAYADYLQGLHLARVDYENAAKAIPHFERVIEKAPDSALGYAGLADALLSARYSLTLDSGFESRALTALTRAEQLDPESAHVQFISGRLSFTAGHYERAYASYRRASELDPNDAEAYMEMGRALGMVNRLPEAEAAFQKAFAVQPGYYKPHLLAGGFYYAQRNFPAAEREWLEAVKLAPDQTRARLNLASLYLTTRRLAEGERQVRESLAVKRTRSALELLAAVHQLAGRHQESVAALEEAVRLGPNYYKTWVGLAEAYQRVKREADAQRTWRRGLEDTVAGLSENPRDADRIAWCAFYHAKLGEKAAAHARAVQAWSVAIPAMHSVRKRLVITYDLVGDLDAALRLLADAPAELVKQLVSEGEASSRLQRDARFQQLLKKPAAGA